VNGEQFGGNSMLLPSRTRPQIAGSMEKRGNGEAVKRRNGEVGKFAPSRFTHYELRITLPINCCCTVIKGGKRG